MSDPNVNDAVEPYGEGAESAEDALAAVEGADVEDTEASEAEAADTTDAEAADDESAEASEEEAEAEPEDDRDPVEKLREELRSLPGEWYVIHTYAGYENRVKTNLEQRAVSLNVEDYIFQAEVPQEEVVQIKNGDRKTIKQNKLPGYVLVRMDLTNESWGVVRNTPGVTGFVGNAYDPYPLTLDEIVKMLAPEAEEKAAREAAEAEGKPASAAQGRGPGAGLRGRRLGHRHRRPVRHAAGDHQRDQPRLQEGQGSGGDLRPRDAGRALLRPDPEELAFWTG